MYISKKLVSQRISEIKLGISDQAVRQRITSKCQLDSGRDLTLGRSGLNKLILLTTTIKWEL